MKNIYTRLLQSKIPHNKINQIKEEHGVDIINYDELIAMADVVEATRGKIENIKNVLAMVGELPAQQIQVTNDDNLDLTELKKEIRELVKENGFHDETIKE